jgi:hypothetical protein
MHLVTPELGFRDKRMSRSRRIGTNGNCQGEETSMTVKTTNRSHRVAYIVALFLLAVALTTALVMAAEQNSASEKKVVSQSERIGNDSLPQGPMGWECV